MNTTQLIQRLQQQPVLLFENTLQSGANEPAWLFSHPVRQIVAHHVDEVMNALDAMDQARLNGHYLAGYITYEAACAFSPRLVGLYKPLPEGAALLQFHVFDNVERLTQTELAAALRGLPESPPYIHDWQWQETEAEFMANVQRIKAYTESGDAYQVNHTARARFTLEGSVNGLYQALRQRQPVAYSALLHLPDCSVVSLSPELFLRKQGTTLTSQPMKGTAPRGHTPEEDQAILQAMQHDSKLRSENLMILDLMRNDMGRIANTGSVSTRQLFEIQTYPTLHQMISTVQGEVDEQLPIAQVFQHLFPCGSITGAPKIRSMEIIHELEKTPRGVYTGALGFITPENDFCFNVPIRTLYFPAHSLHGILGTGGGIIHESQPDQEWQEALLKTRYLSGLNESFQLIETCRYQHVTASVNRLDVHLARLAGSAQHFGFPVQTTQWVSMIQHDLSLLQPHQDLKIRLLLDAAGQLVIQHEPLAEAEQNDLHRPTPAHEAALPRMVLYPQPIVAANVFRQHKTTRRDLYNRAFQEVAALGFSDALFLNENGFLAEASRHNLLIQRDGVLHTPPVSDGALPGIMRQTLLANPALAIRETHLQPKDLEQAERIFLCNSVRGVFAVTLAPYPSLSY